ncbi:MULTISPECIES: sigma-70 family RNA polymerase sigma factor [unclassified Pseudomonas]|uniref:sigma-70 family RNA polymerase sigma factor n=1 Tax=unclassified Pseudomonas TaxID=196821 RepID=UPI0004D8A5AA|nr:MULTISPECIES: sigma-70 family RNA polymerase sigma factor [unclassified Pseudomonas]KES21277.1 RNA polymerase subunit sigma-24 [Pseudomonas sp. AAC]OHR95521.1 RNA polymerase subunit sigma-24 [Pseudomonas sp. HMSC75E02]
MNELDDQQLHELLPRLRRFALSLTREAASADDLVQATLEKALSAWGGKRGDGDLRAWLFAILYRLFVDGQRRARRYARILALFGGAEERSPSTEDIVSARSTLEAFERLPAEQRALLTLVSVEGLSYREVGEALQIPIGTVMSRLSRARQALRALSEGSSGAPSLRVLK